MKFETGKFLMKSQTVKTRGSSKEVGGGREGGVAYLCLDFVDVVPGSIEIYNIKWLSLKFNIKKKNPTNHEYIFASTRALGI